MVLEKPENCLTIPIIHEKLSGVCSGVELAPCPASQLGVGVCCKENSSEISYSDSMVSYQLVRGLKHTSMQEKVLALAATNTYLRVS